MTVNNIFQSAVISIIKKTNKVTYKDIAHSIGVHNSHIQKVSKGKRLLAQDKFQQLCQLWNIDIERIARNIELDNKDDMLRKTLIKVMTIRNLDSNTLSEETGIPILRLLHIQRGKCNPTNEEIKKLSNIFKIESELIDDGFIALGLEIIEQILTTFNVEPSMINVILDFIKGEI